MRSATAEANGRSQGGPRPFPGSYDPEDCLFLLTPIELEDTPVADKERLIQSGKLHYSEMVSRENPPSRRYTELFLAMTERYRHRLAGEILALARHAAASRSGPLTVVSLARAGTPIGALLHRALRDHEGRDSRHFSISIIRDRGLDQQALAHILRVEGRPAQGVIWVDGWTAKGVITRELKAGVANWNAHQPERVPDQLYVVSDIGGSADIAATYDDYVIPNGIMNATVSGLVSRSVLNARLKPGDFHGCLVYDQLMAHDRSHWFLERISSAMTETPAAPLPTFSRGLRRERTEAFLQRLMREQQVSDINRIKPGIAEATRVMLRRVPDMLILRQGDSPDVAHLQVLAAEKGVEVTLDPTMPFNAAALIRDVL